MAYPSRVSDLAVQIPVGDNDLPPVLSTGEMKFRPVNFLDNLGAWAAMIGVLLLLAGGVIIASVLWFGSILVAGPTPDEGPGE